MSVENTQAKTPTAPTDDAPAAPGAPAQASASHGGINLPVLQKLRQHHVGRVALLYLGVSWIILEPVHVIFHMLEVPEWANRLVIVVMVLGFPLTVIPAWIYAAAPATMKPDAQQARHSGLRRLNRRLNFAIAAVAALMGSYFLLYHFWLGKHWTDPISEEARTSADAAGVPGIAVPQRSIAVLPFVDMSQARDQQYLADGLADELLNLLTQIPELRVAARTSSSLFKNKPADVATMAKDLHVAHLLEGSVRKAGNRVRISAQLIRADSGYELWSETYTGTLDDLFQLQDQIAGAVVQALKVKLLGGTLPVRQAPANQEAYDLYLQGRFFGALHTKEGFTQALDYLERAVKLDPGYEPSWTALSIVYTDMAARGYMPNAEALPKARDAVRQAIELNPKSARAHVALGYLHMNDDWDWTAADREIGEALALEPGSADVLHAAGSLYLVLGRVSDSVKMFLAAVARDPLRASSYSNLGVAYFADGRLAEAEEAFRKSISLRPGAGYTHNGLGLVLQWKGNLDGALDEMKRETDEMWRLQGEAIVYAAMHRRAESDAALSELTEKFQQDSPYVVATVYGYRGEVDPAFHWLERALEERDATLTSIKSDPLFQKIKSDPRYSALLQKAGLPSDGNRPSVAAADHGRTASASIPRR
jgi:TolB-like protein/Tfp pilus assembly protein PilF